MIDNIFNWLEKNYEWFFSGLGVLLISFIVTYLLRKKNRENVHVGDSISVHGHKNIGKVEGKDKIEIKFNGQQKTKN